MFNKTNYIYSSLKGCKRRENQDNFVVIDEAAFSLFIVFDGVSSAKSGKQAVMEAKEYVLGNYKKYIGDDINLRQLMYDLNKYLLKTDLEEPYSTYCAVYVDKKKSSFIYSWLGDSRLYIMSNQFAEPLTQDDSYYQHMITKFLGSSALDFTDFRERRGKKDNHHLLICTDGFYRLFESNKLAFFNKFLDQSLKRVRKNIVALVKGKNTDDSTFIFLK